MIRLRGLVAITAVLALCWAGAAAYAAEPQSKTGERLQVYELVRSLIVLQNQVVQGDERAHVSQRKLLDHIAEVIEAAPAADWEDTRNSKAVINYALGGGSPKAVRLILNKLTGGDEIRNLAEAAVLYAEGQQRKARDLLKNVEPRKLETSLGGHVALIKGVLLEEADRVKALENLQDAILLSPGTIVEEAALRRAIPIVARMRDFKQFSYLLARYLRRFGASVYAPSLMPEVAVGIAANHFVNEPEQFAELGRIMALSKPEMAREFYLMLAQTSVGEADTALVRFAAQNAEKLSQIDSVDLDRAKLYGAAAMVVSEEMDQGLARLMSIEKSRLGRADIEVVDAAFEIAKAVRHWPPPPEPDPAQQAGGGAASDAKLEAFAANQPSQSVTRAQDTIANVDAMLQELD